MYVGVDYYPEHWERRRWEHDARLMQQAGFNVVRMAEFAWIFMEPEEGRFDFSLFDEALDLLAKHGISAIMGTPTAAMPAWVARKYPETLATTKEGVRLSWGTRKNNCFTSGAYRLLSQRVTEAMARHFSQKPNVIGWQTDNEFREPACFCESCRNEWRDWLARRYGSLEALNRAWGTHFWGHILRRWDEIVLPTDLMRHNPSACLDWQRYHSWLNVRFQRDQVNLLRQHAPGQFILHNFILGVFPDVNYHHLAEDLDYAGWDNYSVRGKPSIPYHSALKADLTRGLKGKNYWIMEQTAGPAGSWVFDRNPRPGEIRKVAYQQLARGGDHQIWFRWRTCTAGKEQYWHGLLGHDGKPLRRYREAARTAEEFHKLAEYFEGTTLRPKVAILYDFDSQWAIRIQPGFDDNDYLRTLLLYYGALFRAGVNADILPPTADFSGYKAVLTPNLHILPDPLAQRLNDYVDAGGVLLADCRTGVKDATNLCHERTLPGLLSKALGIVIEEYEAITADMHYQVRGQGGLDGAFTALHYIDWATAQKADVLAAYQTPHLRSFAAATRNAYGKGHAYYVGTRIQEEAFYDAVIADLLQSAKIRPVVKPPHGVEVTVREGKGRKLIFLVNHTDKTQQVKLPRGKRDLITGEKADTTIELEAYGVAVIE